VAVLDPTDMGAVAVVLVALVVPAPTAALVVVVAAVPPDPTVPAGSVARGRGPVWGPLEGSGTCRPTTAKASAATFWAEAGKASAAAKLPVRVRAATTPAVAALTRMRVPDLRWAGVGAA
jgi:hypothetical protein